MDENTVYKSGPIAGQNEVLSQSQNASVQQPTTVSSDRSRLVGRSAFVSPLDTPETQPVQGWKQPGEETKVTTHAFSPPKPHDPSVSSPPLPSSVFSYSSFMKIVLGVVVVGVIVFLFVHVLLPLLFPQKTEKVTLSYWGLWEQESVMRGIISDFERENPNIHINYAKQDIKQYRQRLMTRVQNSTGPDIFRFNNTWLSMLQGILLPLPSDTITKDDFQKWFYPVAKTDLAKNGAIYGIPLEIDTLSLFINTDLLAAQGLQAPTTWDDFSNIARKLTVPDESGAKIKTAGAALGTFDNITHAPDIISLLFVQNGADTKNFTATAKNAVDALNFYTSFATGNEKVWNETLDPSILAFAKGNLAMYFGYSWDVFTIRATNPDLKFKIYPVPHLPSRNMTMANYWAEGVSVKSAHKKEALLFMKYLAKKEVEQKFYSEISKTRLFGEPYAQVDLAETLRSNELVYPFVSQGKDAVSTYFVSNTLDDGLNSQLNVYLGNAIRSMLNNTSAESAVDTLSQGTAQVLQQYGGQ